PAVGSKARVTFLEALSAGWSVTHAAARAGGLRQRFYEQRDAGESFASAWDEALAEGADALEGEARRRAGEGWEEPVYQRGELVGQVRKYSDNLLVFLLKARDPARFRESVQVNAGGEVTFVLDSLLARARGLPPTADAELGPGRRIRRCRLLGDGGGSGETAILGSFEPTERQLEAARACLDPGSRVVVMDGAIRSGKTQAAARILLEWALERPATYLVARSTYRSLKDSTEKALLFGDGG